MNDVQFGNKTIQRRILPNSFVQGWVSDTNTPAYFGAALMTEIKVYTSDTLTMLGGNFNDSPATLDGPASTTITSMTVSDLSRPP